jgi:hypothetical protein
LRFGNVAGEEEGSKEGKLNRYLFVTARVDESKFPRPVLEDLPELPPAPADSSSAPAKPAVAPADNGGEKSESAEKKAGANPPGQDEAEQDKADQDKADQDASAGQEGTTDQEGTAQETASQKKGDSDKGDSDKADSDKGGPGKAAPETKDEPAPAAPAAPASDEEVKRKKLEAERERITKENQRKLDKWEEDKRKAEEKVRELNSRFAPWYYVISEDVYKKIHLSRNDILKESSKSAEEGTGLDAFRKLEKDGLKKAASLP